MKKKFALLLSAVIFTVSTLTAQSKVAKISGKLNIEEKATTLSYDGAEAMLGASKNIEIKADAQGNFSIEVPLTKPEYYKIKRNTLYLSPGDNLQIIVDEDSQKSTFRGKGAEANNYLRDRLFPKGGSFLEGGRKVYTNTDSMRTYIQSQAKIRLNNLSQTKNVTQEFKNLEEARIYGDMINSYIMYAGYRRDLQKIKDQNLYVSKVKEIKGELSPDIKELLPKINSEANLNLEVVRGVFSKLKTQPELSEGIVFHPRIEELYTTLSKLSVLSINPSLDNISEIKEYMKSMKYDDLKTELSNKLASVGELVKGAPAIDFEMEDKSGKKLKLSDLKGKYIYIDFWATWCGPCKGEAPHFEKLRADIPNEDITFIAVSTDNSKKAWLEYLNKEDKKTPQYHSADPKLRKDWLIAAIPRFILIDKDFNIVDAYAVRPSSEKAKPYFENLLKQ